jgi:hypothetical protein
VPEAPVASPRSAAMTSTDSFASDFTRANYNY